MNVVVDRLDQSDSTGGRATEKSKDEEGKDEPDSLPEMQFRPYSDGSDGPQKSSKSTAIDNVRSTLAKNAQGAGSLATDDAEDETASLRMSSSVSENPFMSVKAVSFTPSFQPSPTIQSSKLQEPHSSTLPATGSQTLANRFSGPHMSHDNFNPPGNARSYHATQGGQSPLPNHFGGQPFELPRLSGSGVSGRADSPLRAMHQSSNPFKPSASKAHKSQAVPFGGLGQQHSMASGGNSPQFAFQAYNPQFQAQSSYPHSMPMVAPADITLRKTESATAPSKGEKAKSAQKTSPFGKKSAHKSQNVREARQNEAFGDHQPSH